MDNAYTATASTKKPKSGNYYENNTKSSYGKANKFDSIQPFSNDFSYVENKNSFQAYDQDYVASTNHYFNSYKKKKKHTLDNSNNDYRASNRYGYFTEGKENKPNMNKQQGNISNSSYKVEIRVLGENEIFKPFNLTKNNQDSEGVAHAHVEKSKDVSSALCSAFEDFTISSDSKKLDGLEVQKLSSSNTHQNTNKQINKQVELTPIEVFVEAQESSRTKSKDVVTKFVKKNPKMKLQLLCVDILNYSRDFLNLSNFFDLESSLKKVKKFIEAALNSGYLPEVFIDARIKTQETLKVWKKRRESEILKGNRDVPQGNGSLLGDMFSEHGVIVHYSFQEDNDDTVAAYAYHKNGCILSGDKDFLCYDIPFYLFSSYYIKKGYLYLNQQSNSSKKIGHVFRSVSYTIPITSSDWLLHNLGNERNYFRRGNTNNLTRELGNGHEVCKELRHALYLEVGYLHEITEEYPLLENEEVIWLLTKVNPKNANPDLISLLYNPSAAISYYKDYFLCYKSSFDKKKWNDYIFSMFSIILELCSVAIKRKNINVSLVGLLLEYKSLAKPYLR